MRPVKAKMSFQFRSCTIRRKIQICETKLPMARQKIAGILCVFQDFLTQSAAILAAKICVEAIGTASKGQKFYEILIFPLSRFRVYKL